jgi:hypothetical protein
MTVIQLRTERLFSADEVCADIGITYRILDYWLRKGSIVIENPAHGSGSQRRFTASELLAIRSLWDRYEGVQRELAEIADGSAWALIRSEQQMKGTSHDELHERERHPSARRSG